MITLEQIQEAQSKVNEMIDAYAAQDGYVSKKRHQAAVPKSRYHKSVAGYDTIDVYDVLRLYEVESHPVGHAIKKLLMAGRRGSKGYRQDLQEAVDSIFREIDTLSTNEEKNASEGPKGPPLYYSPDCM